MRACKPHRNIVAFVGQCTLTFPTLLILEYSSIGTLCNYFKRVCIAHLAYSSSYLTACRRKSRRAAKMPFWTWYCRWLAAWHILPPRASHTAR